MGESWMQTASIMQAVNMEAFAKAGQELPSVDAFMPNRYRRPKKRLSDQLFRPKEQSKGLMSKVKSIFKGG